MLKYTLALLVAISLVSCGSSTTESIEISTIPVEKPILTVPNADELNLRSIEWTIITKDNFEEKITDLFSQGEAVVFFALTAQGYENLSLNINDLRTHIEQKNSIIYAYRRYYTESETALDKANNTLKKSFLRL